MARGEAETGEPAVALRATFKGRPPEARLWPELLAPLRAIEQSVDFPLWHGTDSVYLDSILVRGLGAVSPPGSTCPGTTFVADGRALGGRSGAYAFALRGGALVGLGGLALQATRHGGRGPIERYVAELGYDGSQARLARAALRVIGARYTLKRGRRRGTPLLLLYEGAGLEDALHKTANAAPADWSLARPLDKERLRLVLVPERELASVRKRVAEHVSVQPLELIELAELFYTARDTKLLQDA